MEADAIQNFTATVDTDLSFRTGDVLKILEKDVLPNMHRAELHGLEGLVHTSHIAMRDHRWYYAHISSVDAELLLMRQPANGVFLIRHSESSPREFCLSVKSASVSRTAMVLLRDMVPDTIPLVQAMFDFAAKESDELNFKRGDIIVVLDITDENWWKGSLRKQRGLIPSNYVRPYVNT